MATQIGIFGGTFNPVHVGHLILADEACYQLELSSLLWVLTPDPPHKKGQPIISLPHREAMLKLAISGEPHFQFSAADINRPGPHYAVETVKLLAEEHPGKKILYIMGGDSLRDLPDWHRPRDFVNSCDGLGVMRRPGDAIDLDLLESILPGIKGKVHFIHAPLLDISSSEIRQRIAQGGPFRHYLTPAVYRYIQDNNLYRA